MALPLRRAEAAGSVAHYDLYGLSLEVHHETHDAEPGLAALLHDLSFVRVRSPAAASALRLAVGLSGRLNVPPSAQPVFQAEGVSGLEDGDDFYLSDGASTVYLRPVEGWGEARLSPSFFSQPLTLQRNIWAFALLKLLRPRGLYSLHAAGVVSPEGQAVLISGPSSSGKSTLSMGLIRQGWRYLSDDAVLLRAGARGIEALAFRKHFYIDASAAPRYADVPLGDLVPDTDGGLRRRVYLEDVYPGRSMSTARPHTVLFSRIAGDATSTLRPLDAAAALQRLLEASGPQLFDKATMTAHMSVLKRLLGQVRRYELHAGRDLYACPVKLDELLAAAEP